MDIKTTNKSLYKVLEKDVEKDCQDVILKKQKELGEGFVSTFLHKHLPDNRIRSELDEDLKHKTLYLDNTNLPKKKYNNNKKNLTAKERKQLSLFKIPEGDQKYVMYEPLHELWKDYMKDLINFERLTDANRPDLHNKLLKADYHGAMMTVTRSRCPSLVGTTGLLLQETRNTFRLITKDDRLKTIPKQNTVFTTSLEGHVFTIYGNHFRMKASERSHKKFKYKPTIDL